MTDTGQIPGEGLPENAGMVEQPGVPAPGAYTYLSEADAEDEDLLLLPGAQSAWGNEVAPPAPEPVVETVHQPGPHELSGRDSGSVDLGGVRLPDPASTPVQPRRPLHLGPPIPDASASPVRSLADRGPAAAPVRHPGPPAAVPEYLDAPQVAAMPPQSAAPWGAQGAPQTAPASAGAGDAETVVPVPGQEPEPLGAAQALVSRVSTEAVTATGGAAEEPGQPGTQAGAGLEEGPEPTTGEGHEAPQPQEFPAQQVAADGTDGAEEGVTAQAAGGVAPQTPPAQDAPASQGAGIPAPHASPEAPLPEPPVAQDGQSADAPVPAGPPSTPADPLTPEATAPDTAVGPAAPDAADTADTADAASAGVPDAVAPEAPEAPVAPVGVAPSAPDAVAPEAVAPDAVVPGAVGEEAVAPEAVAPGVVAPEAVAPDAAAPEAVGPDVAVPGAVAPEAAEPQPAGPEQSPEPGASEVADRPEPVADADVQPQPPVPSAPQEAAHPHPDGPSASQETAAVQPDSASSPEAATARPDAQPGADQPVVEHAPADHAVAGQAVPGQPVPGQPVAQADPQEAVPPAIAPQEVVPQETAPVAPEPDGFDASADAGPDTPAVTETPVAPETLVAPEPAPGPRSDAHLTAEHPPAPDAPRPAQGPQSLVGPDVPDVPQEVAVAPSTSDPAEPDAAPAPTAEQQPLPEPPQGAGEPAADQVEGQFPPVEGGQVPTTPAAHEAVTVTPEVPVPREAGPELAQNADDLATRAADQEDEADQILVDVPEVRRPTGPAAPAYDDAERAAVLKVMRERRDIRNGFRSDPIPHEVLLRVLEAAHTAPSVGHSQPWDFVVIRSEDTRRAMHELAMRQRDAYAKSLPKGRAKQFKELKIEAILDTPVNIVVTADPTRGGRHTLGRHTQPQMAPYSSALAVENLWLAARAEGLGVGWVSFFDEREMVRALGLPEHLDIVAYLCVGYVDEFPDEPELMQAGWSKRRPLSWVVHEETYGRRALPGEAPHDLLAETVAQIRPLDAKALGEAWERQKRMTKPAGALGMLEIISAQLSGLSRQCPPPIPEPAAVAVFAGDHGVHAQGVTPWPQEVTAQMVANFLGGGAVCNAFATQVGAEVCVVDVGVATDLPATPGLLPRKIRGGTSDMTTGPAMTREEAKQAVEVGIETARDLVAAGNKALLTGEMGIANTTASAALISVFTGVDPAEVTGRGTGINDETLARKTEVVRRALELHQPDPADPVGVLAAVGGFEHAAMVGLLLGGASLRTPVILDGVSAGAAALVARAIAPEVLAACIAGHRSAEPGHVAALNKLGLRPLVDLDLRLGEGTGALLALPMVQSTARAMHEVATFDSAGVTEK
ncbi:nicotinate-nucleotide--dimethylbenzimidazole phosphoribosyltransferase [Streptomyces olivaceus]|uniref:nicotinate-nucleotide--dimethylbenzimidazole phosphoribosyltransferase n=1 Tax=Streptomyces olivaceus TaxID=47716 RepID=UPI001CCEF08A|nr:nicotinate-nucleotide--dimethylbenzimidazole phosphoribosyltransferase [Streptomyces olivaceus]MBZ6257413.1 nicotinate-nucleotide--dimethylbenzimidazole phosphoribosyltransferase [Streptomyces olivaceus]